MGMSLKTRSTDGLFKNSCSNCFSDLFFFSSSYFL